MLPLHALIALLVGAAPPNPIEVGPGIDPPKPLAGSLCPTTLFAVTDGSVVVRLVIQVDGTVGLVQVVEASDPRLANLAMELLPGRKYVPARRDGRPIAVWWPETLRFRTDESIPACHAGPIPADQPLVADPAEIEMPGVVQPATIDLTPALRQAGRGSVTLQCVVDECGHVGNCNALKSSGPEFEEAGRVAVRRAIFTPAKRKGEPVAVFYTFRFDLGR